MITVWGRATSSNVQAVMWTIGELGLAHRRIDCGHAHGGLDTPAFRAMNPHGRIPVIRDGDGPPIWESWAILLYLAAAHGGPALWPADPTDRARIEMWGDWIKLDVASRFTVGVFWPLVRTPEAQRDGAALERALDDVFRAMWLLDRRLGLLPWVSGEAFGLADIMLGHILYRYYDLDIPRHELPNLAEYYARLCRRPAYAEHVMISYEPLRVR